MFGNLRHVLPTECIKYWLVPQKRKKYSQPLNVPVSFMMDCLLQNSQSVQCLINQKFLREILWRFVPKRGVFYTAFSSLDLYEYPASIISLIEVRLDAQSHQTGGSGCWGSSTVISETGSRGTTGCLRSITHLRSVFVKASQGGHPSPPQAVTLLLCWEINSSCLTLSHPFVCYLINVMIGFWQVHLFHFQSLSQNDVQTGSLWPLCKLHCVD